jgi:hypothetical protein
MKKVFWPGKKHCATPPTLASSCDADSNANRCAPDENFLFRPRTGHRVPLYRKNNRHRI